MRSLNSKHIDPLESAYMADAKRCGCVVCDADPPNQAHHPEQGQHFCVISVCPDCHGGPGYPHGWHGDKSRWRAAKMTPLKAMNETRRRVELLRAGKTSIALPQQSRRIVAKQGSALSSSKCLPRRA